MISVFGAPNLKNVKQGKLVFALFLFVNKGGYKNLMNVSIK